MHMLADLVELVIGVDTPQAHPYRRGRDRPHRSGARPDNRAGHPIRLPAAAAIGPPTRRPAGVSHRGHRRLRCRPHSLPPRPRRASRGVGPARAGHPPPLRQVRRARRNQGGPRGAGPRAARPAPRRRAAGGVLGAAGRPAFGGPGDHHAQRQLHALVVAAPNTLRERLGGLRTPRLVATCGRLRLRATWDTETMATVASLRALARRIQLLNTEIAEHTRAITTLVRAWRPTC